MKKKTALIITATVLAMCVLIVCFLLYRDRENRLRGGYSPMIMLDTDTIMVSVSATDEELLAGVTALDRENGDVTDSLIVEGISPFYAENRCIVTYVAFDESNNVSKISRIVEYTDYTPPVFVMTEPLSIPISEALTADLASYVQAYDCKDGDISRNIKVSLLGGVVSIGAVGEYDVQLRVTNSLGDTATAVVRLEVHNRGYSDSRSTPDIRLSNYILYTDVGERVDVEGNVAGIVLYDELHTLEGYRREHTLIIDDSGVDYNTPGQYEVVYRSVSEEANLGTARLIVIVRGAE
ncbi:MAG: hypothetical protein Q4B99_06170 [Clostridia bacterium]|nr:hypothetical protein [Clostridia bacterium]